MNISQNNLMEITTPQQMTGKTVPNHDLFAGFDNFRFDSIISSISSKAVVMSQDQYNTKRDADIIKQPEQYERNSGIGNKSGRDGYDEVKKESGQRDRYDHINDKDSGYGRDDNKRSEDLTNNFHNDNERRLDEVDKSTGEEVEYINADELSQDNDSPVIVEEQVQSEEINETETFSENNDLLINMLNAEVDALVDGQANDESEGPVNNDKPEMSNATGSNLPLDKSGLSGIMQQSTEEIDIPELTGKQNMVEKGAETDSILTEIVKGKLKEVENSDENAKNVITESSENEDGEFDQALNDISDENDAEELLGALKSDKSRTDGKNNNTENKLSAENIKNINQNSEGPKESLKEVLNKSAADAINKQDDIKGLQLRESTEGTDIPDSDNETQELSEKMVSEIAQRFGREGGLKENESTSPKTERINTDNKNANMISSVDNAHGAGKFNGGLKAGSIARPAGLNEVAEKIVYVVKGNNRLDVTIDHKDFGKLKINLSLEKGMVNVTINTPDRAIKEFVENNIQQIINSIEKDGPDVGGFSVALKNNKGNERFGTEGGNRDHSEAENGKGKDYIQKSEATRNSNSMISVFA